MRSHSSESEANDESINLVRGHMNEQVEEVKSIPACALFENPMQMSHRSVAYSIDERTTFHPRRVSVVAVSKRTYDRSSLCGHPMHSHAN